tara:strand:+ start:38032 stop:40083 length:2052 start_codon:yes stop_codon:yes gene_type:complete
MAEFYPDDEEGRVAFWQRQIEFAEKKFEPYWALGDVVDNMYNNDPATSREENLDSAVFDRTPMRAKANFVFAFVDQSIANLLDRNPTFRVTPKTSLSTGGAPVVQSVINHWYRETGQFSQDKRCLLDAFLYPYAVKKIGYTAKLNSDVFTLSDSADFELQSPEEENMFLLEKIPVKMRMHHEHANHIEIHTRALQDPQTPAEVVAGFLEPHIKEHEEAMKIGQPDTHVDIQYEAPFGTRWHPRNFLWDPTATDGIRNARWIAFKVRQPLYAVKANAKLKNTDDLEANLTRDEQAPVEADSPVDFDDFGMVDMWEIWVRDFPMARNKRSNMLLTIAPEHDKFLMELDEWPYENIEDYPVEVLSFNNSSRDWLSKPVMSLGGGDNLQLLLGEFLDSMISVIRKQKNTWLFDSSIIDDDKFDEIRAAPESTGIGVEGLSSAPSSPVTPLPFQEVHVDKQQFVNMIQDLFDRTNGTPTPQQRPGTETATEIAAIEKKNTSRESARGNLFKEFQVNTARKMWGLHSQFRPPEEFLIDPRTGAWSEVKPEVLQGEYRFAIDISSQAVAMSVERKTYLDLLNLFAGLTPTFMQIHGTPPNLLKLAELLLTRGYGIADPETFLPGSNSAFEQLQQQMEDPNQRANIVQAMASLSGGGAQNQFSPGPVNTQQFAANAPSSEGQAQQAPAGGQ